MADYYIETTTGEELPAHSSPLTVEEIDEALVAAQNSVRFDKEQFLSEARKAKARANIGVSKGGEFKPVGFFETYELMEAALPNPEPGVFAGVGTAPPYDFYCWDGYHQKWEPQGQLTSGQGSGLPPGGTEGQVLSKASDEDGDAEWKDVVARAKVEADAPETPEAGDFWFDTAANNEFAVDNAPTSGSSNLVTSGGVFNAINAVKNDVDAVNDSLQEVENSLQEINTKISAVLLWENPNTTANFAAQTINLDLSEYGAVLYVAFADTVNDHTEVKLAVIGYKTNISSFWNYRQGRPVTTTPTGAVFEDAAEVSQTASMKINNSKIIPYKIFGIKGVQL